ncbi:MAG: hypothetical protein LBJ94_00715 [Puniceicoccales bacterium]|jgi:type II secretory pathway pseudopilin PulG|nr:hypothetical protein [Puniceicoccales bacterium]
MNKNFRAFGLVGILLLTLIVGMFGSMVIVGFMLHRNAELTARTRIQFVQYEAALKAYCREYGEMPPFIGQEEPLWLNRDGNSELLIKALSGKNPDDSPLSQHDMEYLNPFCKRFYTFSKSDFFKRKDGTLDRSQLADAFNNTNICIVIESSSDSDTAISREVLPQAIQRVIAGDLSNTQIAIFSIGKDNQTIIVSWSKK